MLEALLDIHQLPDFQAASAAVLSFLHQRMGFNLWMVTRTEGDDWIVLQSEDHGYNVQEGTVFRWADSFCSQMVAGNGPHIAPDSDTIPVYASALIGKQVKIGAYVGMPLAHEDGTLFGTLCAIHPHPQPDTIRAEEPLIHLLATLLSSILASELKATEEVRKAERARLETLNDGLTGLYNRRGWDQFLEMEESRCRRYGHPACVISIDLNDLKRINDTEGHASGDALLQRAAQALRISARKQDIVARLGGDEFAILGVECDRSGADILAQRLYTALEVAHVSASIGIALRVPSQNLVQTCEEADAAMYAEKRQYKLLQMQNDLIEPAASCSG